jgi:CheY-like chemotaxis protein
MKKRLRQILLNLLSNAIKFTEKGGVCFKVSYHENQARFEVEDTGSGIAAEALEEIFLPFQQMADKRHQVEGTGLGLSISKRLVEMMGGRLQVTSTPGKGSLFWFEISLPEAVGFRRSQDTQQAIIIGYQIPTTSRFAKMGRKTLKILVVDDSWQNRAVLVSLLTRLGFQVSEACHGGEALEMAEQFLPDAILTDLVMPVMDGFELARQIRQNAILKDKIIIANSASVFELHQNDSLDAGCNAFMTKPIRTDILLALLQEHLNLEWLYDAQETVQPPLIDQPSSEDTSPLVGPTAQQASILLKAVMTGNIRKILEEITELEQQSPELQPFLKTVRQLVKHFEMIKLKELIKQYM